jgi:hypothetical protein
VLTNEDEGRRSAEDVTLFDSTGLAIQDLAIATAALAKADGLDLPHVDPLRRLATAAAPQRGNGSLDRGTAFERMAARGLSDAGQTRGSGQAPPQAAHRCPFRGMRRRAG